MSTARLVAATVALVLVAGQSAAAQGIEAGGVRPVELVRPEYPRLAAAARVSGDVTVVVRVRTDGGVAGIEVVHGIPLLTEACQQAAEASRFECPGCLVEQRHTMTCSFGFDAPDGSETDPQSGSRVHVTAASRVAILHFAAFKVRSVKCLYLWRCGTEWGGMDFYNYKVRSAHCAWLWKCGWRPLIVPEVEGAASVPTTQEASTQGPTLPFEAVGACPFEGCVYREWTAQASVVVRTERRADAPVSYEVQTGERLTALTGVVVILRAGRVQFRAARRLAGSPEPIHIEPGQTLYLLNYLGEGFTNAWFNGRLYTDVDTAEFYNFVCDVQPSGCAGTIIEPASTEWWVQVRNHLGRVGWTDEPDKFSGKNALFDDVQLPPR